MRVAWLTEVGARDASVDSNGAILGRAGPKLASQCRRLQEYGIRVG